MGNSAEPRDRPAADPYPPPRYSAFISYNHADERFARKLQRRLEGYRLPSRLSAGRDGGPFCQRLRPVFRDSDELAASYDLTIAVRDGLAESEWLIVICSPRAAASQWVAREIELFRAFHGEKRILATIIDGTSETAFPAALQGTDGFDAPLAADFRATQQNKRLEFLRLVAAVAGVRLDELVQREAQRHLRRVISLFAGALSMTAILAALAVSALTARADAESQRSRTGGLTNFLLSDLRQGLQAAGRTDLLTQVDQAALKSYAGEHLSRLTPEQLEQRAKAQHALGEDSEKRGDLTTAQAQFEAAWRSTATLWKEKPDDPKRIFTHAQSEYWVGFIRWREGDGIGAQHHFEAYARLAHRLVQIDPRNDDWVMETVYAANNLGMLLMRHAGRPAEAERKFRSALQDLEVIARRKPGDPVVLSEKVDALAWLADSQRVQGHWEAARATRAEEDRILAILLARNPRDVEAQTAKLAHDLAVARIDAEQGELGKALAGFQAGQHVALDLEARDPENKNFPKQVRMFELFQVRTWLAMAPPNRPPSAKIAATLGDCRPAAPGANYQEISDFCSALTVRLRQSVGDRVGANQVSTSLRNRAPAQQDVLTARWGLNLAEEAGLARTN